MKMIKITCKGAATAALEDLQPLQGGLKTLSERNYQKLKAAITGKHGFSFPFAVWKNKGKLLTVDGHQRLAVLLRMKEEGVNIPPLPVDYIEARNIKEAREKILLATSQYGRMTEESLGEFLKAGDLKVTDLKELVDLPEIDVEGFAAELEEFGQPSASVKENIDRLNQIASRRKENAALVEKRDTEKFLIVVFESREQKIQLLRKLNLPSDERYVRAGALMIRRCPGTALIKNKSGRNIKAPPIRKAGAA